MPALEDPHGQLVSLPLAPATEPTAWLASLGVLLLLGYQAIAEAAADMERRYDRAELLTVYRRRRDWKKSDTANLRTYQLSPVAERRIERLGGVGRPVVRAHIALAEMVLDRWRSFQGVVEPAVSPRDRLQALKHWPWWPHYVEALYRGEHLLARDAGVSGAAGYAEQRVADLFAISSAKVHKICGEIRRKRRDCYDDANFPAATRSQFEEWLASGETMTLWDDVGSDWLPNDTSPEPARVGEHGA